MGKFGELKDFIEMLETLDADEDVKVEVITSRAELDKRLKELDEEGYTLIDDEEKVEKKAKKSKEEELEEERQKALNAKERIVKKEGKERADNLISFAAMNASIKSCLDFDIPIREDMFNEYNSLCEKVYPERSDPLFLALAYSFIDRVKEEGVKSLE